RHARDMSATEVTDVRRIKEPRAIHRDRGRLDLAIARREQRRRTPRGRHFIQMAPTVAFPDERDAVVGRPEKLVAELPGAVVLVERVVDGADPRSRLPDLVPHRIWQARTGVGSVYYPLDQHYSPGQFGDELFWSANDRIAFVWERDGWRHLYEVPASGGAATLLTPGDGEVETAAISMDRSRLFYATNIGDLGRRHISSVSFDGSAAQVVTGGDKSQWAPIPLAGGRVAYLGAGWADPPR